MCVLCSQFSKNKLLDLSVGALGAGFIYVFHSFLYSYDIVLHKIQDKCQNLTKQS